MKKPAYCIQCDQIKLTLNYEDDETVLNFMQDREVVQTRKLEGIHTEVIVNVCAFIAVEPPKNYTVEELIKVVEDKVLR